MNKDGHHLANVVAVVDFRPEDQPEVRALILAGLVEHWGHLDEALNPDLADIAASYAGGRTVVIRSKGAVVGTGTIVPRDGGTAEILRMSVASGHRRSGVGRRIVRALLDTARGWGATAVVVETSAHWNDAVAFYEACGFEFTHTERGAFGEDMWFRAEL